MVIIEREKVHNIPILHVVKQDKKDAALPFIIFIHGISSIKERNIQHAYMLAEKGYRVILPDALYHGERYEELNIHAAFWKVVITTIHEVELLKNNYEEQGLIRDGRIGLAGTSMGAIITLGALNQYDWIKAGVSLMGNPAYVDFAKLQLQVLREQQVELPLTPEQIEDQLNRLNTYDATLHLEKWKPRPLFFWHGKSDNTVPYEGAYNFYQQLQPLYSQQQVPLTFSLDEHAGHVVPNKVVMETVDWFAKFL